MDFDLFWMLRPCLGRGKPGESPALSLIRKYLANGKIHTTDWAHTLDKYDPIDLAPPELKPPCGSRIAAAP